ncbi:MAG: YicC family protein [Candidatus Amulumruptor caecigallinarius]|nr:YicC family protein [Candidatus Amulumruptor caecigallinarius]
MILSMTGFGRGSSSSPDKKITVEIKSLNSKQFDMSMREPYFLKEMEVDVRNRLASMLERGKMEFQATSEFIGKECSPIFNQEMIRQYKEQIVRMGEELDIPAPADWYSVLLRLPDAMKADNIETDKADLDAFMRASVAAAEALTDFRINEGKKLYKFFVQKIKNITALLKEIEPYELERVPKIKARLEENLARLTSVEYDRGRLEQELIFYIEKLDVTEEKTRLAAHLNYFLETMGAEDVRPQQGQGKKLGFIAQEMGREINTLGSKSNHAEMQKIVVKMKDELEQIKEQVLNVL